jgi:hypothetical protein
MSGDHTQSSATATVDEAMNRVLAAERDARLAVAECRAEAARIIAAAERRARALAGRSEAHIKAAHRRADAAIENALADLVEVPPVAMPDGAPAPRSEGEAPPALAQAIGALVAEILGEGSKEAR